MQIDDIEDKVVKCTSLIEEEWFVSFSVFPWENPWRTQTIHGKMSTKKSHKLTNIVNGPEKTSWPFPQFTTSANKGEAWECSAYILPTSNIDKDPPFLFLNLKKIDHLYKKPCPWSECRGSTASRSWAGSLPPKNFAFSQTHICPKLGSCRPGCICQHRGREPRSHLQRREVNAIYNNFEKKTRKTFEWKGL